MKYEAIVIGAGISGMAAALILSKNGQRTALVEASSHIGPLLRGFTRQKVFFDTGFHYTGGLGDGEILDLFFRYLGLAGQIRKTPYDAGGFDVIKQLSPPFEFRFPYGYPRIRRYLHDTFPFEKEAVNKYLQKVHDAYYSLPYINLDSEFRTGDGFIGVHSPTLRAYIDSITDNVRLKSILCAHCLLHGVPPDEVPFENHAAVVGSYYESVHGIRGGGLALVQAFDRQLGSLGVDMFCGQPVEHLKFTPSGNVCGVMLQNGICLETDRCVVTTHPHRMLSFADKKVFRPAYIKRLEGLEETFSAFIVYVITRRGLKTAERANLLIAPEENTWRFEFENSTDKHPMFIAFGADAGPDDDKGGLCAITPMPAKLKPAWRNSRPGKRPQEYDLFKAAMADSVCRRIEMACPELAGDLEIAECATPLTLRDYTNSPYGSMYGVKHREGQYNPIPVTRAGGLFLAGQAVTAPGILGAIISSFIVCGFILGHNRLRSDVKGCI